LEEALRGGQVRLLVPAQFDCPTCHGRGGLGQFECLRCHGRGVIVSERAVIVSYPEGVTSSYFSRIPLDTVGIENLYLTVRFRVSSMLE